jgi:hypothetical protein
MFGKVEKKWEWDIEGRFLTEEEGFSIGFGLVINHESRCLAILIGIWGLWMGWER